VSDAECIHGLDERWCSICLRGTTKPEVVTVVATFRARFDGHCRSCNLPLHAGELATRMSDESYRHEHCG